MGAMGLLGNVMMGVGGKVIDYAMQEGRLLREERMRELDRNWRSEESAKDRTFRSEEARTDREFRSGESEKEREFKSGESEADREFRSGESKAERELRMQLQGSSQAHGASEAEKARAFQAEQAEKTRANGLLTKIEEDGSGKKYRVKADGSIEYLDGVQGIDKRKQLADKAARERADSVIGKDSGMQAPEQRNETWQKVYDQEMERQGYGSGGLLGGKKSSDEPKPVVGDTPPKGEVSPGAGAVWSDRVGGWVAKDTSGQWRKVVVNKPPQKLQEPADPSFGMYP